jgi:uncharacterized protein (DUF1501 family)
MNQPNFIDRRQFIGQAGCAALGTTGLLSTLLNLGLATRVMATEPDDYKAMICIFLLGGNDSYNMLMPANADEYAYYLSARGGLYDVNNSPAGMGLGAPGSAVNPMLPIQPSNISGRAFGIHPNLTTFQQLFNGGNLAFVSNVGSMQKPIANVAEYKEATLNNHPLGLFSHSDQQQQWQTCMPDKRSSIGWAGRAMDILQNMQPKGQKSSFSISLAGTNILQTGNTVVPYTMNVNGLVPLEGYQPLNAGSDDSLRARVAYARSQAVDELLSSTYRNIFEQTYAKATIDAQDSLAMFQDNLKNDAYPDWDVSNATPLEKQLKLIANVIHAYKDSPTKRQTFFLTVGGYDMHRDMMTRHVDLMTNLNSAVGKFWSQINDRTKPSVTLFSASDFGRTLSGNGNGTDHAWGGNHFVLGGAVKGGQIFGDYPIFNADVIGSTYDVGQGRLIPGYSVEEYVYPVLKWFGVSDNDLFGAVFPGYATRFGTGGIRKAYPLYG